MADYTEKNCPKCGQRLRFPKHVGGVAMACPSCGTRFHSDFKLGAAGGGRQRGIASSVFELPGNILKGMLRIFRS